MRTIMLSSDAPIRMYSVGTLTEAEELSSGSLTYTNSLPSYYSNRDSSDATDDRSPAAPRSAPLT